MNTSQIPNFNFTVAYTSEFSEDEDTKNQNINTNTSINTLPIEVFSTISRYLDLESIKEFRLVCRKCYKSVEKSVLNQKILIQKKKKADILNRYLSIFLLDRQGNPLNATAVRELCQPEAIIKLISEFKKILSEGESMLKHICIHSKIFNMIFNEHLDNGSLPPKNLWDKPTPYQTHVNNVSWIESFVFSLVFTHHMSIKNIIFI